MRVAITGTSGQLGRDTATVYEGAGHDVVEFDLAGEGPAQLDIGDRAAVLEAFGAAKPDLIISCAAFTAVDACETEVDLAYRANAMGPRHIAEAARATGAHLVHISTDYVFDGTKDSPYVEWDAPNPQSVYGASKLAGELEVGPEATIVRTSWVCGQHGNNIVKTILRLLGSHPELKFVNDQVGHPTFTTDLAQQLFTLGSQRRPGIFHVTNAGAVSWYEFAREVTAAAGEDPDRVKPITTAEYDPPLPAHRPANSVLDNAALRLSDLPVLRDFREPLAELVTALT